MKVTEYSSDRRIRGLAEMTRRIESSSTAFEALRSVLDGLTAVVGPMTGLHLSTEGLPPGQYRVVMLRVAEANLESLNDPWADEDLPVQSGGVIGDIIRNQQPQIAQDVDWSADPFFAETLGSFRSLMAVPLNAENLPVSWVFVLHKDPQKFTPEDLAGLYLRASLVGALIQSRMLAERLRLANEQITREAEGVGRILRCLLPDPVPVIPGLQMAASFETFAQAGGDLYDFVRLDDGTKDGGRWGIFIGDASGHGPSAAVVIAVVQALLRAHPPNTAGPAELLRHVNIHLCERPIESSFVTAFLAIYEPVTRRLTYAGAGHPLPLLRARLGGTAKALKLTSGYPLGIDGGQTFTQASVNLDQGDTLLFYTDGISEARNPSGGMFEASGIEQTFNECNGGPREIVDAVHQAVSTYSNGYPATDDRTLLAISVV
jgi:sigma-B regulation protein RsbU (phosphoserine phosphatase)